MKLCIFCSANEYLDSDFFAMTKELGEWAGRQGHDIVFGGTNMGLMDCVARSARQAGARIIGVTPTLVEQRGRTSDCCDVTIPCSNLHERKALMEEQGDVFIALPGGIGTLDEVFTVAASATIGYHRKRVILYNMKGFWDSLIQLMDDLQERGVIRGSWRSYVQVASTLEELQQLLEA